MGYNVHGHEYRHFKKQTDNQYSGEKAPTTATQDNLTDEAYSELTGFHHEDELYTNYGSKPRRFRKHTKSYERRFTINSDQTFVTIRNQHGCLKAEISGNIHPTDKEFLESSLQSLPIGLTLTLTEVFKKIETNR